MGIPLLESATADRLTIGTMLGLTVPCGEEAHGMTEGLHAQQIKELSEADLAIRDTAFF
jgi:hypothetical protein